MRLRHARSLWNKQQPTSVQSRYVCIAYHILSMWHPMICLDGYGWKIIFDQKLVDTEGTDNAIRYRLCGARIVAWFFSHDRCFDQLIVRCGIDLFIFHGKWPIKFFNTRYSSRAKDRNECEEGFGARIEAELYSAHRIRHLSGKYCVLRFSAGTQRRQTDYRHSLCSRELCTLLTGSMMRRATTLWRWRQRCSRGVSGRTCLRARMR